MKKVVALGLDGTPYTLIKRFSDSGIMENCKKIFSENTVTQMNASLPEVSSVSWSSCMTGKNPAKHGIFGFTDLKQGSYAMIFPNFHNLRSETLWDILGEHDKRSVIINMPATYPAKKLNGLLISGFVAIDLEKAVYPMAVLKKIREFGYNLDVDLRLAAKSLDRLMDNIFDTLHKRIRLLDYYFDNEEWDLFFGIITGTDRLHHFFWDAVDDLTHAYYGKFIDYYRQVDDFIGKIYNRLPDNTDLLMMSDHGFTGITQEVYLSNYFIEHGFLKLRTGQRNLNNIDPDAQAFVMDPGRIYVHTKGKYPYGNVEIGSQRDELLEKIIESVSLISIDGVKPVKNIYRAEEIYSGNYFGLGPDLVLTPEYGYDLKATLFESSLYGTRIFKGMHTYDDAFVFSSRGIVKPAKPSIMDIAPSILSSFGIEPPEDIDGTSVH